MGFFSAVAGGIVIESVSSDFIESIRRCQLSLFASSTAALASPGLPVSALLVSAREQSRGKRGKCGKNPSSRAPREPTLRQLAEIVPSRRRTRETTDFVTYPRATHCSQVVDRLVDMSVGPSVRPKSDGWVLNAPFLFDFRLGDPNLDFSICSRFRNSDS